MQQVDETARENSIVAWQEDREASEVFAPTANFNIASQMLSTLSFPPAAQGLFLRSEIIWKWGWLAGAVALLHSRSSSGSRTSCHSTAHCFLRKSSLQNNDCSAQQSGAKAAGLVQVACDQQCMVLMRQLPGFGEVQFGEPQRGSSRAAAIRSLVLKKAWQPTGFKEGTEASLSLPKRCIPAAWLNSIRCIDLFCCLDFNFDFCLRTCTMTPIDTVLRF